MTDSPDCLIWQSDCVICNPQAAQLLHYAAKYGHVEGGGIVIFQCLDFYHKSPDSGERQYKPRA